MANLVLCTKSRNWVHGKYAKINRATARLAMHLVCSKCKEIMEGTVDSIEKLCNDVETAPINFCLNVLVRSPTPLGWVEMAVGLPEGSSYPRHSPSFFSLCCPLNNRRRAAHSIYKIGRLFSLFLLSCPTLALLRLLILLFLLMSSNVHPNTGPSFPCSVCPGNVTWRGKSLQCCTCSK